MSKNTSSLPAVAKAEAYDARTRLFHWACAALVFGLWIAGHLIDFFPKGPARINVRSLHFLAGAVLGTLVIARLVWRRTGGTQLPHANQGVMDRAAVGVHYLLYALMGTTVLIGIACVWIRGDSLFNLYTVPAFNPENKALREEAVGWHELSANLLLALSLAHGAAAVWHHRILKDGVLRRMLPSK